MPDPTALPEEVRALLDRSNRLGSDPAVTNYGGGNTSAKVTVTSPASGEPVELLYVKGSGGDLGTLTADGSRRARARPAGGPGPGLPRRRARGRDGRPVRLLRATAPAVRRPRSTPRCTRWSSTRTSTTCTRTASSRWPAPPTARSWSTRSGAGRSRWVPWKRPGWELGRSDARAVRPGGRHRRGPRRPRADRLGLDQPGGRGAEPADHPRGRRVPRGEVGRRAVRAGRRAAATPLARRRAPAPRRRPVPAPARSRVRATAGRSVTSPTPTWCSTSSPAPRPHDLVHLGTSCPDHFLRTKVRPLLLDTAPDAPLDEVAGAARRAARRSTARSTAPTTSGTPRRTPPRCAAPHRPSSWCPASGCSRSARTSRRPGWPASSTSTPST